MRMAVDYENTDRTVRAPLTMRVHVETSLNGHAGIQHAASHHFLPQNSTPVIRSGLQRLLVQQAVIARRERIVHHDLNASLGQPPKLIEISERIEEGRFPSVSAACCP